MCTIEHKRLPLRRSASNTDSTSATRLSVRAVQCPIGAESGHLGRDRSRTSKKPLKSVYATTRSRPSDSIFSTSAAGRGLLKR
jgi:hypothetical protein